MTGTVKYLKKDNGYFFIAPDHGGHEIFGHVNVCSTSLNFAALMVGDKVSS